MPTVITEGVASARGFGFGASSAGPLYIEDVFSTYLYTGTGATQTITNGIDLSTKGGLVWLKDRTSAYSNILTDTARGATKVLSSDGTYAQATYPTMLTAFNSNGFSLGSSTTTNQSGDNYASWSFRKQAKFFDIVTYTGTGANRTIAHNLGSTPGCIIVKRTDTTSDWQVYHSGLTSAAYSIQLNLTSAQASATTVWNSTAPTSSVFSVGTDSSVNASGGTYVAYLFASNAGGFGAAGTDNVITCGSFTENNANNITVNTGYEPQYVMFKCIDAASPWYIVDSIRGIPTPVSGSPTGNYISTVLQANTASAEGSANAISLTSTGFIWYQNGRLTNTAGWIYIAIRRGPMKTPTSGTSVFDAFSSSAAQGTVRTTNFPVDTQMARLNANNSGTNSAFLDRLRGVSTTTSTASSPYLASSTDVAESTALGTTQEWNNTGFSKSSYYDSIQSLYYSFRRAPGFFDVVCYTGTGTATTQTHNLGVVPEFIIIKNRSGSANWITCGNVYSSPTSNYQQLSTDISVATTANIWTAPTSTTFGFGSGAPSNSQFNASSATYVAYLFATVAGVSKVGSYTGNGTTQTINCGFGAGGVRFVLIKRTDSTGDWYAYDTARGMTVLTDPYLLLNSTGAEVATLGSVTTVSTGFALNSTILAAINTNAATYIFLAIA